MYLGTTSGDTRVCPLADVCNHWLGVSATGVSHAEGLSLCFQWEGGGGIQPPMRTPGGLVLELEGVRNDKTLIRFLSQRQTHPHHAANWPIHFPTCLFPNLSPWLIPNPADNRDRIHQGPFTSLCYTLCCPNPRFRNNTVVKLSFA